MGAVLADPHEWVSPTRPLCILPCRKHYMSSELDALESWQDMISWWSIGQEAHNHHSDELARRSEWHSKKGGVEDGYSSQFRVIRMNHLIFNDGPSTKRQGAESRDEVRRVTIRKDRDENTWHAQTPMLGNDYAIHGIPTPCAKHRTGRRIDNSDVIAIGQTVNATPQNQILNATGRISNVSEVSIDDARSVVWEEAVAATYQDGDIHPTGKNGYTKDVPMGYAIDAMISGLTDTAYQDHVVLSSNTL